VEPAFSAKEGKFCLAEEKVYGSICGGIRSESSTKIEAMKGAVLRQGSVHPCQGRWPSGRIKPDGLQ